MVDIVETYGWSLLVLVLAGALAGLVNGVVGSGTLITFPVMILIGVPPLTANVSSNLGLIPGSVSAAWQYRVNLSKNRSLIARMLPLTLLGALCGALLLLALPSSVFASVVPVLIGVALAAVLLQPVAQHFARNGGGVTRSPTHLPGRRRLGLGLALGLFLMGVYGAYFGAAQGIPLLVVLSVTLSLAIREVNGFKNLLAGAANAVSGLVVLLFAPHLIDWVAVVCIAIGAVFGGGLGGKVAQALPPITYRIVIVLVGVAALWATLTR